MYNRTTPATLLLTLSTLIALFLTASTAVRADDLAKGFASPPASAKPWVYWFWLDGNITRQGITADLEAMRRVGVGGVLIMEVDQGAPKGPAAFAGPQWRELFKFVLTEAKRLGLEVNMNNDAGWCGSGGPWITPALAMQKMTWSTTNLEGPQHFEGVLATPEKVADFYEDITVIAFPTPAEYRIEDIKAKAAFVRQEVPFKPLPEPLAREKTIARGSIRELTAQMGKDGRLVWDVPAGKWTVLRLGHTPTGKDNHPAPLAGRGLECDKLSKAGADAMFAGLMGKLIADSKPLAGKTLVATHIDSWEVGSQNWTTGFREEFKRMRGYDPLPFFPVMTGRVVDNLEVSERFLWDLRQTISDLVVQNYAGRFRELAHKHGLRLSIEAYDGCCDDMTYAGQADEPMGEFWSWTFGSGADWCTEMASAAHIYGKQILGAEAFTATDQEKWLGHPGNIKALGDWAFCEGINRFVFHRYALQPWADVKPGMSMGPWGLHYERTSTWWEQSKGWHEYLSRCQFLLQQGQFVADVCYLAPEAAPGRFHAPAMPGNPSHRPGYNFDGCTPEVVLKQMKVKDGQLVLPSGMSYRVLVLPEVETMTPQLLRKVAELVKAGAKVVGPAPLRSPSLADYPRCDEEVRALTRELWPAGAGQGTAAAGRGRVTWPIEGWQAAAPSETPARLGAANWIWFKEGKPAAAAPTGKRYFRRLLNVEDLAGLASARMVVTADNEFVLWVNGAQVGSGNDFSHTYVLDCTRRLKAGTNLLAVAAVNGASTPNPAGLIATLILKYKDGRTVEVPTDSSWEAAKTVEGKWTADAEAAGVWQPAMELGKVGMAPWGEMDHPAGAGKALYPGAPAIAKLMKGLGVSPDFDYVTQSAERDLRYIHKRIGKTDLYFVANEQPHAEQAICSFRVQGKRPELWWPDGGQTAQAAVYEQVDDCVRVPIRLDPSGSVFVIFRTAMSGERERITSVRRNGESVVELVKEELGGVRVTEGGIDLARGKGGALEAQLWQPGTYTLTSANGKARQVEAGALPEPLEIYGPWDVSFQPALGGPGKVSLDRLISWSEHSDARVKFYSGTATYAKQFEVKADLFAPGRRLYLDLGKVEVMAGVKVNGKDLGVLWKQPYCVEVTDVLKPGQNTLEVAVVNLWPNRMIGDEQLPEDSERNPNGTLKQWPQWLLDGKPSPTGRYTFTSWRLYQKDSPLVESGLIGPVKLRATQKVVLLSK
jgi:hypothetical protein